MCIHIGAAKGRRAARSKHSSPPSPERYSEFLPPRGTRCTLREGPSRMFAPFVRNSRPTKKVPAVISSRPRRDRILTIVKSGRRRADGRGVAPDERAVPCRRRGECRREGGHTPNLHPFGGPKALQRILHVEAGQSKTRHARDRADEAAVPQDVALPAESGEQRHLLGLAQPGDDRARRIRWRRAEPTPGCQAAGSGGLTDRSARWRRRREGEERLRVGGGVVHELRVGVAGEVAGRGWRRASHSSRRCCRQR